MLVSLYIDNQVSMAEVVKVSSVWNDIDVNNKCK